MDDDCNCRTCEQMGIDCSECELCSKIATLERKNKELQRALDHHHTFPGTNQGFGEAGCVYNGGCGIYMTRFSLKGDK